MSVKAYRQELINAVFLVYLGGAMLTPLVLGVSRRWQCIQEDGFLGIFWCDVLGGVQFSFFKAGLWPYFLYQWLSS